MYSGTPGTCIWGINLSLTRGVGVVFTLHHRGALAHKVSAVLFSWDVRGTSSTKSTVTVTKCVKRVMVVTKVLISFMF